MYICIRIIFRVSYEKRLWSCSPLPAESYVLFTQDLSKERCQLNIKNHLSVTRSFRDHSISTYTMTNSPMAYPQEVTILFPVVLDPNANINASSLPCPTTSIPVTAFLERHLNESYTTLITRKSATTIPLLEKHVNRLQNGFRVLHGCSHVVESTILSQALQVATHLMARDLAPQSELRIVTVLKMHALYVHAAPVPETTPTNPVLVECRGKPRMRPGVKDTSWVVARRPLESIRQEIASETILIDAEDYALYEGLTTNIFVVMANNIIYTAPSDRVLSGTIRECVIQACQRLGVPVVLKAPPLANWLDFRAAFLTNAFRILTPIRALLIASEPPNISIPETITLPETQDAQLLNELRNCVYHIMDESAFHI